MLLRKAESWHLERPVGFTQTSDARIPRLGCDGPKQTKAMDCRELPRAKIIACSVRVTENGHRPGNLPAETSPGLLDLILRLGVRNASQDGMGHGVWTETHTGCLASAHLLPRHGAVFGRRNFREGDHGGPGEFGDGRQPLRLRQGLAVGGNPRGRAATSRRCGQVEVERSCLRHEAEPIQPRALEDVFDLIPPEPHRPVEKSGGQEGRYGHPVLGEQGGGYFCLIIVSIVDGECNSVSHRRSSTAQPPEQLLEIEQLVPIPAEPAQQASDDERIMAIPGLAEPVQHEDRSDPALTRYQRRDGTARQQPRDPNLVKQVKDGHGLVRLENAATIKPYAPKKEPGREGERRSPRWAWWPPCSRESFGEGSPAACFSVLGDPAAPGPDKMVQARALGTQEKEQDTSQTLSEANVGRRCAGRS